MTKELQSLRERLTMKYDYGPMVRIPIEDEPRHMLLEGNTSGGKTRPSGSLRFRARF